MPLLVRNICRNATAADDKKKVIKKQTAYNSASVNLIVTKERNTLLLILAHNIVIEMLNFFHRYSSIEDLCFFI